MSHITLEQATAIKSRIENEVMSKPGVTGVDVGFRGAGTGQGQELALRVYVDSLNNAPALPSQVEGLPVEVIERRFGLQ